MNKNDDDTMRFIFCTQKINMKRTRALLYWVHHLPILTGLNTEIFMYELENIDMCNN